MISFPSPTCSTTLSSPALSAAFLSTKILSDSVAMVVMILFARFKVGIGTFLANKFRNQEGPTNLEYLNKGMKSVKSKEAGLVEAG